MSQFLSANDPRVTAARAPLYDANLPPSHRRQAMRDAWHNKLVVQYKGSYKPVCMTAAIKIFVVARATLALTAKPATAKSSVSRGVANAARAKKSVSVAAWLTLTKSTLDVMPDQGWYMLPVARKGTLFEQYELDAAAWPHLYTRCKQSHFLIVWAKMFPEIRLRKHCRFAKCGFCVGQREIQTSGTATSDEKAVARERLTLHINWALKRERGIYHDKKVKAFQNPLKCISIALDGTDQFINGFPHFWETTKADAKGKRLYLHTQVCIVHGTDPYIFCAHEDIAGDPNWTIETLYRALRAEEIRRPEGLPKTFYLQVDNCFRENKNTYLFAWLCWLVERGVFDEVFVSFLPTGHTHFDPDQFASRIAVAVRFRNVKTVEEYLALIKECWRDGQSHVQWVDDVMDVKELLNPGGGPFPVGTARCKMLRGIGTKSVQPLRDWFMCETSPLHWRVRKDTSNKVMIQSKFTFDDRGWSTGFYPWTEAAPRPDGRPWDEQTSGLVPTDTQLAPNKVCSEARAKELREALDRVKHRLTDDQWAELEEVYERVTTPRQAAFPPGHGRFNVDDRQFEAMADEGNGGLQPLMFARATSIFHSQSHQQVFREQRQLRGHASTPLEIGKFVAYMPDYTVDTPPGMRQDFWVGQIIALGPDTDQLQVRRYHTNLLNNLTHARAAYRAWTGEGQKAEWIENRRVLEQFKLTVKGKLIGAPVRAAIGNAIELFKACTGGAVPDLAVGRDPVENPHPQISSDDDGDHSSDDEGDLDQ